MTLTAGFIGLGTLGRPLALRLLAGGVILHVHDPQPGAMAPLVAAGAVACGTPAALARAAEAILIALDDGAAVEALLAGEAGLLAGARPGQCVAVLTTLTPALARDLAGRLAAAGVGMVDAPLSGEADAAGGLSIPVGGREADVAALTPLLERLGGTVVPMGPSGAGSLAQACHRVVAANALEGVAEALTLARKSGVDPGRVREALLGGFAGTRVLEVQGRRMLARDFVPGFPARSLQETLREVLATAHRQGFALPGTALAAQHVNALVGGGGGDDDLAALVRIVEALNGLHPQEET